MKSSLGEPRVAVLLTVHKRKNLRRQLDSILGQTLQPDSITVFQNGLFQRLPTRSLRRKGVDYVINSANTGYFGRFTHLFNLEADYFAVLDDDIIPGVRCLENYVNQAIELGGIVGGNGRIARTNPHLDDLVQPPDTGRREVATLVDFVGHMWVFERSILRNMFAIAPATTQTGEDMHLCFTAKKLSGVRSYVAQQVSDEESCDITNNKLSSDEFASFRSTPKPLRESVERYFFSQGVKFITPEEQRTFSRSF